MGMTLFTPTQVGGVHKLISQVLDAKTVSKKNILNIASAFDTEVSSFYDEYDGEKSALVYVWMFGIENEVVYGRTLDDFKIMCDILNSYLVGAERKLIVYIHNFKYDFQFIKTFFKWDEVFSKSRREILYTRWGNIEFRDSLALSGGTSLAFIGRHLKDKTYQKLVGDLNYSLLRTPITPLTDIELGYCENDIRVLVQYIREKIASDGDITKIPYTNTGYVRNYVRNACFQRRGKYMDFMDGLTMTANGYAAMQRTFMGGAVGPNLKCVGRVINDVASFDIKSSYPYVMVGMTYPMSYAHLVPNREAQSYLSRNDVHIQCTLEIFNLVPRTGNDYCFPISESKCRRLVGAVTGAGLSDTGLPLTGSGRVISAQYVMIDITELDYYTFKKFYEICDDNIRVSNMRVFVKGYLPKPIVESIMTFFNRKTTLDGVEGREAEYMLSKNMLNSIYGMMVEKVVRDIWKLSNNIMNKEAADYIKQIEEYNNKWNRFLYYPWGVWVTAWARYRLYDAIAEVGKDFVYCDTDSVKFTNLEAHLPYFEKVNAEARSTIEQIPTRVGLTREFCLPKSPKGDEKCLGVWEHEFTAKRFKTLGAKRYLVEFPNGERKLTVAGTNPDGTLAYLINQQFFEDKEMFQNFNERLVIPADYSKRLVAKFIETERSGWVTDYLGNRYYYRAPTGIHMEPAPYSFSITEKTKHAIEVLLKGNFIDWGQLD